ncbi:hypothetical protein F511_12396 [Dorcoceras hygrometricum]|uniref:Uncharacterized protein n=1 Tax=Dorcoceras hygrometricum TaxID=472368 RepID=A0A2Z7BZI6_9LAMI|nr:hypothetical protein F511_12396 [Dorcoceras hygrometricum]
MPTNSARAHPQQLTPSGQRIPSSSDRVLSSRLAFTMLSDQLRALHSIGSCYSSISSERCTGLVHATAVSAHVTCPARLNNKGLTG